MKIKALLLSLLLLTVTSCQRTSSETWEDVKTAGRFLQKSVYALWGSEGESRQIAEGSDFTGPSDEEYLPLIEDDLTMPEKVAKKKVTLPPSPQKNAVKFSSNEFGLPSSNLANIFRVIHFNTDNHVIQDREDLITVARIASYLKKNPNAQILIEGHTDKRASADYNMALGMRRAHHIEVLLKKQGVSSNQIKTASFGKEKLLSIGNTSVDHKVNRRAEFKIQTR